MYLEFDWIYGTDKTVLEIENGMIKRLLDQKEFALIFSEEKNGSNQDYRRIEGYAYPGFNDSHMHLIGLGKKLSTVDCVGCKSVEEVRTRVADFIRQRDGQKGAWVLGRGWNQDLFEDKVLPSCEDLDRVSADIPIAIHRVCGHIAVLNTKALEESGLLMGDGSVNEELVARLRSEGGDVDMRDGRLTGILREFACDVIKSDYALSDLEDFVLKAQSYLLSLGITSVQTDDFYFAEEWRAIVSLFERMEREKKLKMRVYEQSQVKTPEELSSVYIQSKDGKTALSEKRFRLGPLKILSDGSLGARTAYMTEPYADDGSTRGILAVSEERLRTLMFAAAKAGTDSAVHGIGDGSIEILLNINEEINRMNESECDAASHRNTIIHCQVMSAEQIDRMANLGLGAMVQPIFLDYDLGIIESRVGAKKAKTSYAYRTMLDKGIRLSFGSDAPVEDPNPLMGMHFAVNREEEAINLDEAIHAYTVDGAYFSHEEEYKGLLKEGYVADIAVFAEKMTNDNLKRNVCVATLIGGELVFQKQMN